jgi:acyl carrier protein
VDRQAIVDMMMGMLQQTLDAHLLDQGGEAVRATPDLSLIGEEAAVSSMALVSFIADVESTLAESFNLTVTLVSERALSRKKSPFRTVDALADYVLELVAAPSEVSA